MRIVFDRSLNKLSAAMVVAYALMLPLWVFAQTDSSQTPVSASQTLQTNIQGSEQLRERSWMVDGDRPLSKFPPSMQSVKALVSEQLKNSADAVNICSFAFYDLARIGVYELIASVDFSGRDFCNTIVVITPDNNGKFSIDEKRAWEIEDVTEVVRHLDHSLIPQIILREDISQYEGSASCVATWERIYELKNGHLEDVSASFPDFYRAREATLTSDMEARRNQIQPSSEPDEEPCELMEADKILRFLKTPPTAGFERASLWMKGDSALRSKAVDVFADIGDEASLQKLAIMTKDSNVAVAESAQIALSNLKQKR